MTASQPKPMIKKEDIRKSYEDLGLPFCEEVIKRRSADVLAKYSNERGRYPETTLQRAFRVGIQFVSCCRMTSDAHIHQLKDRFGKEIYVKSLIAEAFLSDIQVFALLCRTLSSEYIYHEYVEVLQECCQRLGLTDASYVWNDYWYGRHSSCE